ncbi:uncharacterized protein LOC144155776 [Haemaphysalis longicornis]
MKWDEIFHHCKKDKIDIFGVTETHLRETELPPLERGFEWEGLNRKDGDRRGGGVGVIWKEGQSWHRVRETCREHLWITGRVGKLPVAIAVIYMGTGAAAVANDKLYECLLADITALEGGHAILLIGGFNGHLEQLGGCTDPNGRRMQSLAQAKGLVIANLTDRCRGVVTWASQGKVSSIDYGLLSLPLFEELREMVIDEDGTGAAGSDHRRLRLVFGHGGSPPTADRVEARRHLPEDDLRAMAERLENVIQEDMDYEALTNAMTTELRRNNPRPRRASMKPWWDCEVRDAIRKRQAACREHRKAQRSGDLGHTQAAWDTYKGCKAHAAALVQSRIQRLDAGFMETLRESGRDAPRRFWERVKRSTAGAGPSVQSLRDTPEGPELQGAACLPVLERWARGLQGPVTGQEGRQGPSCRDGQAMEEAPIAGSHDVDHFSDVNPPEDHGKAELRRTVTVQELQVAAARMDGRTASGSDGIPARLIQLLGPKALMVLAEAISMVLQGTVVPPSWHVSRLKPLYKGAGDRRDPANYRPICVTQVLYRVTMQVIRQRLESWAEMEGVLGALQNGFRKGRRIEDNLFVVTQCIECALQEKRQLLAAFLDISKAYDTVHRDILGQQLKSLGLDEEDVSLVNGLLGGLAVRVEWEGHITGPIPNEKGLRQGCPLSPLLFMLYIAGLERHLQVSGVGFDVSFQRGGEEVRRRIPGVIYADDSVVLADSAEGLQTLLDICGQEAATLGLRFNQKKSAVLVWGECDRGAVWTLQGGELRGEECTKYLGVTLTASPG